MLGVGWTEMLVIGVVALIVIGPKDLPVVMRRIGKFAGTIRRMGSDFQRELNKTTGLDEIRNLRQAVAAPLKATTDAIRKEFNTTTTTGTVQPSGALKPADPKVESVVSAIEEKAGMAKPLPATGALPAKAVVPPRMDEKVRQESVARPRRTSRPKAAATPAPVAAVAPKAAAKPKSAAKPAAAASAKPAPAKPKPTARPSRANGAAAVASEPATNVLAEPKAARRKSAAAADPAKNA